MAWEFAEASGHEPGPIVEGEAKQLGVLNFEGLPWTWTLGQVFGKRTLGGAYPALLVSTESGYLPGSAG